MATQVTSYTMAVTIARPYDDAVTAVREAMQQQGFGVLTEIDLRATLKEKLGADIAPQVILGVCRPPLALAALEADPSIGALLPCNVVVRSLDAATTRVEAVDPDTMTALSSSPAVADVARDARKRLAAALADLPDRIDEGS